MPRVTLESYLGQLVNFGGEWITVGELYKRIGDEFATLWLAGYRASGGEFRA